MTIERVCTVFGVQLHTVRLVSALLQETQPGTPVSSLMQVQKENSPKTVPTRPAGLRRGAEKTRGSPTRSRKGKMKGKGSRGVEKEKPDPKRKATLEPGNMAENAGVKFGASSKGKLTKNRPDETRGSPKRSRKGPKKARTESERNAESEPETKPQTRQRTFDTFSRVRSIIHTEISFPGCTKTVLQK